MSFLWELRPFDVVIFSEQSVRYQQELRTGYGLLQTYKSA